MSETPSLDVEVWFDFTCSWCYVGSRRLDQALERFEHADAVKIVWRSFELMPDALMDYGRPSAELAAERYTITPEEAAARQAEMAVYVAELGLTFDFAGFRLANTFDAHRVMHLAQELGRQDAFKERLLRAQFCEGELLSDHDTLRRLAAEVGLPADEVSAVLASDRFADEVRADERRGAEVGVQRVPTMLANGFIVANQAVGMAGAITAEEILGMLESAWAAAPAVA